ncbi:hypothetical protein DEJ51_31160 [Streptomyces venezuelae]|uniref:Uncharacterized protein n=1 Tax=Streptomyces venezuelae TaxID=54571 RepID=A0A5P2DZM6_STRVZ|nr:hypothetical protein DEJ51_31160 [Streptomyces venezuelae]
MGRMRGLMGYTAVHPLWGRLDASLDDLGCGHAWTDVHRVKELELGGGSVPGTGTRPRGSSPGRA